MTKDDKSAGRPRSGPTIDLKAKEISSAPAAGAGKPSADGGDNGARAGAAQSKPEDLSPPQHKGSRRSPIWLIPLVVAVGAGLPLFGFGWWVGNYASGGARMAPPPPLPPEIVARLDKIEAALAQPRAADPAVRTVADNVAALSRRLDELALAAREARARADAAATSAEAAQKAARTTSPANSVAQADFEALSKRIAALEQATTNKDSALADRISGEAEDQAGRLAVTASVLRNAVERGEPYVAELAAAKALSPDDAMLRPLEPFAASGIPSERSLARELSSLAQPMNKLVGEPANPSGVLAKLQASAERLIRIRPVGDIPGDDPAAIVSRIELKATRTDIEGALQELVKLPPEIRAPAEDWIKKARGREAAVAAVRQFARDALSALGKPGL